MAGKKADARSLLAEACGKIVLRRQSRTRENTTPGCFSPHFSPAHNERVSFRDCRSFPLRLRSSDREWPASILGI